jgi:hypothetical protein
MTMGLSIARLVVLVAGALIVILGLWLIVLPGGPGTVVGLYTVVLGLVLMVGAVIERVRYRADAVDRSGPPIGPGGGEPLDAPLDGRFRPTDEIFVDPTSGYRMRVWLDPDSGERRYRAEPSPSGG